MGKNGTTGTPSRRDDLYIELEPPGPHATNRTTTATVQAKNEKDNGELTHNYSPKTPPAIKSNVMYEVRNKPNLISWANIKKVYCPFWGMGGNNSTPASTSRKTETGPLPQKDRKKRGCHEQKINLKGLRGRPGIKGRDLTFRSR